MEWGCLTNVGMSNQERMSKRGDDHYPNFDERSELHTYTPETDCKSQCQLLTVKHLITRLWTRRRKSPVAQETTIRRVKGLVLDKSLFSRPLPLRVAVGWAVEEPLGQTVWPQGHQTCETSSELEGRFGGGYIKCDGSAVKLDLPRALGVVR